MNKIYEAFRWFREDVRVTNQRGGKIHIRGKAIYPTVSRNNRQYIEKELMKAARTLAGKPIDVNHEVDFWYHRKRQAEALGEKFTVPQPTHKGHVVDAEYEDGAIEYVAEINHPEYVAKLKDMKTMTEEEYVAEWSKDPIYGVSISANFRYTQEGAVDTPVTPLGINFIRLSLVEDPETPGVRGTSIELLESLNEGSVEECIITGSLIKDRVAGIYEVYDKEVLGLVINDGDRITYDLPGTFTDPNDPRSAFETEKELEKEPDEEKVHKTVLVDEIKELVYDIPKLEKNKMTGKNADMSLKEKQEQERLRLEESQSRERMEAEMTALNDYIATTVEKVNTVIASLKKVTASIEASDEKNMTEAAEIRGLVKELGDAVGKLTDGLGVAVGRVDDIKESLAADAEEKASLKESLDANKQLIDELKVKLDESGAAFTVFKEGYVTDKEELDKNIIAVEAVANESVVVFNNFKTDYDTSAVEAAHSREELVSKMDGLGDAVDNSVKDIQEAFTAKEITETARKDEAWRDDFKAEMETLRAQLKGNFKAQAEPIIETVEEEPILDEAVIDPSKG